MDNQTIYALSTVYGKSGVAVIRISGNNALAALKKMTSLDTTKIKSRYAYFVSLKNNEGNTLDRCLILYFRAPNSFTGEDIVELQTHGSRAVIAAVLSALSALPGFRLPHHGNDYALLAGQAVNAPQATPESAEAPSPNIPEDRFLHSLPP